VAGASEPDDDDFERGLLARQLLSMPDPELNRWPGSLIVGLNLFAPQSAIRGAVEKLVRQRKREQGIPERRRRPEKIAPYLRVADLRGVWVEEEAPYDPGRKLPFSKIALIVRAPLATVANRYASAFELVIGHPYTIEAWTRLFAILKFGNDCLKRRSVNSR